jgi:hypothetical protein
MAFVNFFVKEKKGFCYYENNRIFDYEQIRIIKIFKTTDDETKLDQPVLVGAGIICRHWPEFL